MGADGSWGVGAAAGWAVRMEVPVDGGRSVNGVRRAKEVGGMEGQPLQTPFPVPIFQKCAHTWPGPSLKGQMSGRKLIIIKGWRL